ncbi:MAG: gamma-glutamylcyclotransferase [Cohaesibacter sp.]|nr:gamma-glutamylcyclotransferase [Cohaesibacter sp.]
MPIKQILNNPDQWVAYFGYGSLVNDRTRNLQSFGLAGRLKGFRRQWRMRGHFRNKSDPGQSGVTALSVMRDQGAFCDGLLVFDHKDHLPMVDKRETNYARIELALSNFETDFDIPAGVKAYIYIGQSPYDLWADRDYPILQSYSDAVMQGFLDKFGQAGLERFMQETQGWQVPVVQDRHDPIYPRPVRLDARQEQLFDALLQQQAIQPVALGK